MRSVRSWRPSCVPPAEPSAATGYGATPAGTSGYRSGSIAGDWSGRPVTYSAMCSAGGLTRMHSSPSSRGSEAQRMALLCESSCRLRAAGPTPGLRAGKRGAFGFAPSLAVGSGEAVGPVPVPQASRVERDDGVRVEAGELTGPARERHSTLERREVEPDVAERGAPVRGREDDVAVQHAVSSSREIDHPHSGLDGVDVRGSDGAKEPGWGFVLRALLRDMQSSTALRRRGGARDRHYPRGDEREDERQGALHHRSPFSIDRGCPMPISSAATIRANGTPAISL